MRRTLLLIVDVALMVLATLAALALRENLELSQSRFIDFLPYLAVTILISTLVFPLMGLHRTVWRFSAVPEYVRIAGAVTLTVASAVAIVFAYNRLEGVARSLPVLQLLTAMTFLIGARVSHQLGHQARLRQRRPALLTEVDERPALNVLIVGINQLAETYLQAVAEFAPHRVRIAGLVGRTDRQTGRLIANHAVLGVPEDIGLILDGLEVHGVHVDRIVVAAQFDTLSQKAREALLEAERSRPVHLQFMAEDLDLNGDQRRSSRSRGREPVARADLSFGIDAAGLDALSRRPFWRLKRVADAAVALVLLVIGLPIMGIVALLSASTLGLSIIFWQQRPGLGGRPFRLYKFQTMLGAHGPDGRLLDDAERLSAMGAFLRRTRFDELPQLFNILRGDMSFVGPRPLLPRDQPEAYRTRLLVRPGLTGWAQVVGGRDISAADKAALDVWYVQNASVVLDLKIVLKTVPLVLFGERISLPLIERAWRDLNAAGALRGDLAVTVKNRLYALRYNA